MYNLLVRHQINKDIRLYTVLINACNSASAYQPFTFSSMWKCTHKFNRSFFIHFTKWITCHNFKVCRYMQFHTFLRAAFKEFCRFLKQLITIKTSWEIMKQLFFSTTSLVHQLL